MFAVLHQVALAVAACIENLIVLAWNGENYDSVKTQTLTYAPVSFGNAFGYTSVSGVDDLENRAAGLLVSCLYCSCLTQACVCQ